jgi:phospholipid transport system substrate-binding protein
LHELNNHRSGILRLSTLFLYKIKNMLKFKDIHTFRWVISILLFLCAMLNCSYGGAEQSEPSDVIKTFNATLIDSMKRAKELGYSGRYQLLEPVIKDSFALSYMATIAVGKYWKTLNEKEKRLLLDTYTEWTIATYAGRFDDYSGEKFELISASKPDQDKVTVISRLIESDEDRDFYYRLRKMEGKWRIVDIQISGVSQLALTRSQFVDVINSKGVSALISMLKEKIKNFSEAKTH